MKRVTGIGGIFFKSEDPKKLKEWYIKHLGVPLVVEGPNESYVIFNWKEQAKIKKKGYTLWGPFKEGTDYFDPTDKDYMFNFTVDNLEKLLETLRKEGVYVFDEIIEHQEGKFGWILDPEGNKVELWEPVEEE